MTYKPKDTKVVHVWKRLSPEDRETRLFHAMRRLELIKALDERMGEESERSAAIRLKIECDRTTIRRWRERYERLGLDGLIDLRIGHRSSMPDEIQVVICTLRRINPAIDVETIIDYVKEHHGFMTSGSTVKRVLSEHGLNRRPGPQKGSTTAGEQRVELGGMKLLEAACAETGYVEALAQAIVTHVQDLPEPETPEKPDMSGRDEYSRFLPEYNERYRKKPGTPIGPGFASVLEKRKRMNPNRLEISKTREAIIERKLLALLASPIIGGGRWDSMRVSRADILLKEVCGFPYMPATLDRFSRELKYAGVANTLWEVHARFWFAESSGWGDERRAAILYVDGTTKPIWTRLFSQSTKISQLGRTMPGLELVAFHTSYGVPLWMLTHSGRAPLVNVVPEAVSRLGEICGSSSVGRLLVIDAEANSVPFLKGLEQGKPNRAWVTRLRENWVRDRKIFNRTNYRKYRRSDRIRMGVADFNDPDGGTFRMRVVEVERMSGKVTYLGASMMLNNREWKAADIADLYFDRWPEQEANFRAVSRATGFKDVHGYGKQLTDNISVVTEIDELIRKIRQAEERLTRQQNDMKTCERKLSEENRILGKKVRRQETVRRHIEAHLVIGLSVTPALQELMNEQSFLANEIALKTDRLSKCQQRCDTTKSQVSRTQARLSGYREQKKKLESRRKIFAHDVELDSLFSLLKVGLVLMVTYVLREYLGNACMDVLTFLERVVTLPARLRITPDLEILTFEYNHRDPDAMALLEKYCEVINNRGLPTRSKRKLRIRVESAPPQDRPPPPGNGRCKSGGRFVR